MDDAPGIADTRCKIFLFRFFIAIEITLPRSGLTPVCFISRTRLRRIKAPTINPIELFFIEVIRNSKSLGISFFSKKIYLWILMEEMKQYR